MSQGRGDLGPGSYSLLWFLHSKLRFKRQRLSLHGNSFLATTEGSSWETFPSGFEKIWPPGDQRQAQFDSGKGERNRGLPFFLVVPRLTGTGRGVELEKTPKKSCFLV